MTIAAEAVNAGGNPVYRAVGLSPDKDLGGNEFYFSVGAGCKLYASNPGPNMNPGWIRVGLPPFRGDFTPSLGSTSATMEEVWVEGDDTGLGIGRGIGGAYLDVGLAARMEQGRILYRVRADGNAVLQGGNSQEVSVDAVLRFTSPPEPSGSSCKFSRAPERPAFFSSHVDARLRLSSEHRRTLADNRRGHRSRSCLLTALFQAVSGRTLAASVAACFYR